MKVYQEIEPVRRAARAFPCRGDSLGLVPTMGALHEGHVSLIRASRAQCDRTAVTIFVNPSQFAPGEDFERYPRALKDDLALCEAQGVDIVFAPSPQVMYPAGHEKLSTTVRVAKVTERMCGLFRPGHFDGVTTVVAKLFHIIPADKAFFGEKDYQQLIAVRRMVEDLNFPTQIVACPTVREADGLATSSRNRYLTPRERLQAASISAALFDAARRAADGERDARSLMESIEARILAAGPARIDYISTVDAQTLEELATLDRPARICAAVRIGPCRLIDNVGVDVPG